MSGTPRIIVVGANLSGMAAAQHLPRELAVTVVDPNPWFEWLPNIHELVSGVKRSDTLRLPRARLIRAAGHRFVCARVEALDARAGWVQLHNDRRLPFDVCIVAVGGINDTFGVPGADRFAMPFKSVADCAAIGERLADLMARREPVSVVVVGGGLEGVEALGEILRRYRERPGLTAHLVEAAHRLLPGTPAALDRSVRAHGAGLPVCFHLGARVRRVTRGTVRLSSGEILPSNVTIWTGGATAAPLLHTAGLASGPKQWAAVTPTLQSAVADNVVIAGDAAELSQPIGKQAYYAIQMGSHAADTAIRLVRGEPARPFRPAAKPMLLAFGDLDTYLVVGGLVIAGTALALLKEAVFQMTMAQVDRPTSAVALTALEHRLVSGLSEVALPSVSSLGALLRLPRVRILW